MASAHSEPLPIRDLNPLLAGYEIPPALPSVMESGATLGAELAIGNISLDQQSAQDSLQLDAELQRWPLSFAAPLTDRFNLRIELPYISVNGGQLDSFIESWHHTFGLPNGNRATWPSKRLLVRHSHAENVDYLLTDASRGIGDLTLRLGAQLRAHPSRHTTLWLSLKLPTGNAQQLTGSGAADLALSLATAQQLTARVITQQQVSLSVLGDGKRLATQQEDVVWSGSLGIGATLTSHWSVLAQLDGHTQVFDTGLRVLGNALQISFGPRYQSGKWHSTLLISEDLTVDTAPDVQFQLTVARSF